mmetsp:Transcript_40331/g.81347  ORF Transcript_40331/g.81347 Transcript_40331/m.81347 type:complete len:610 (+) Transcript_40331:106-1935(+)
MTMHGMSLPTSPMLSHRSVRTPRTGSPTGAGLLKSAVPAEVRGRVATPAADKLARSSGPAEEPPIFAARRCSGSGAASSSTARPCSPKPPNCEPPPGGGRPPVLAQAGQAASSSSHQSPSPKPPSRASVQASSNSSNLSLLASALASPILASRELSDGLGGRASAAGLRAQVGRCSVSPKLLPREVAASSRLQSVSEPQALDYSPDSQSSPGSLSSQATTGISGGAASSTATAGGSSTAAASSAPASLSLKAPPGAGSACGAQRASQPSASPQPARVPQRMASQRSLGGGAGGGAQSSRHPPQRAFSMGSIDSVSTGGASVPPLQQPRHEASAQPPQGQRRRRHEPSPQGQRPPSEQQGHAHPTEVLVEAAGEEKAKKGVDSGRSSVGRQSTTAPSSRSPRARLKADVSSSSLPCYRRESSLLMLKADSVLSRLETSSSTSSVGRESISTAPGSGSIHTARARHRACVAHLRGIQEQMEDLVAENEALRYANGELHKQMSDLQVKHDAAQCHLDSAITLAVTPRTRRTLDAQKKLLQPALGARLASSFVEAKYQKAQKEKVTRLLQEHTEEPCATKSGAAPEGALSRAPDEPPRGADGEVGDADPTPSE